MQAVPGIKYFIKVERRMSSKKTGHLTQCYTKRTYVYCKYVFHMNKFTSYVTNRAYDIFDYLNCSSKYLTDYC